MSSRGGGGGGKGRGQNRGRAENPRPNPRLVQDGNQTRERAANEAPTNESAPPEDQDHKRIEDQIVKGLTQPDDGDGIPHRAAYGTQGSNVLLLANYIKLKAEKNLFRYKVTLGGQERDKPTGRKLARIIVLLLRRIIEESNSILTDKMLVTDFSEILISCVEIPESALNKTHDISYFHEDEKRAGENALTFQLKIEREKDLPTIALGRSSRNNESMTQALNIFLNYYSKSSKNHITIGSSRSFPLKNNNQIKLGSGLITIKGYYSSIRPASGRVLANINVSYGVFYPESRLDDIIRNYRGPYEQLARILKGVRVKPLYDIKNKDGDSVRRAKTIFGFASEKDGTIDGRNKIEKAPKVPRYGATADEVKFWFNGNYISVFSFFRQERLKTVSKTVPVINVGTLQKPTYLPSDLCEVLIGQRARVGLNDRQMNVLAKASIRTPSKNKEDISPDGIRAIGLSHDANPMMEHFGLSVPSHDLIAVQGRVLRPPRVMYGGTIVEGVKWNLRDVKFRPGSSERHCLAVYIGEPDDPQKMSDSFHELCENMNDMGINMKPLKPLETIPVSNGRDFLKDRLRVLFNTKAKDVDFVIMLLKQKSSDIYNYVKSLADKEYGKTTVCLAQETLKRTNPRNLAGNLALKLNLKLGFNNQAVHGESLGEILNLKETMVVGIDVTHSPDQGAASIAGMVASVDKNLGQWPAVLRRQGESREEMVTQLKEMLETRLDLWKARNDGHLPSSILIYRDGVSEGQYKLVREKELSKLQDACDKLYYGTGKKPTMTMVIVGKRHHTRFYAWEGKSYGNPEPGTVVDRGITDAVNWDFFLQPHTPLRGTARPAHYFVVHDEIFRNKYDKDAANKLETFTHDLCFMFGRSTGAVSICTPAYYADLACNRARCYVADDDSNAGASEGQDAEVASSSSEEKKPKGSDGLLIHTELENTMFYI
ncbi:Piwi-domain-containing protein [Hypoxylon sp. FL1857]|nr:Piwi-domain-containing protein [Hypoxylon sp. FL1857]